MALRTDDDEIWYWYEVINEYHNQKLPLGKYCKSKNIDLNKFTGRYARVVYISKSKPELYKKLVPITRKFLSSKIKQSEFIKNNDISKVQLSFMVTHLNYLDAIERMKIAKGNKEMNFIKIPQVQPLISAIEPNQIQELQVTEVIKKQNDVELVISKGVKVVVSPDVGADKLIRIIELLKDL